MKYKYDALSIIRQHSMPIHKKLDGIGIATHLRNGTLDSSSYLLWLIVTYKFLSGYKLLFENSKYSDPRISLYAPCSLCLDSLENDIKSIDPNADLPAPDLFPLLSSSQLTITPVYTLLGSLMGTQMIYNHVIKIKPQLPTLYLNSMLKNKSKWSQFKEEVSTMEMNISDTDLGDYTEAFWNVVYRGYTDIFGQS